MADIFISYAHEDRQRIIPIARALELAGFSVWWDRQLRTGQDFDDIIETELEKAACVIVCWSGMSRKSRFVKGEAREAVERGVLTPIFLEQVKPPLDLRSLHTEDFSNWHGEQKDDCWQRLILMANALKRDAQEQAETAAPVPAENELTAPEAPPQPAAMTVIDNTGFNAGAAFLTTTLPLMAAAWFLGSGPQMGLMGLTATLALMAFFLFRQADRDLRPHMKALATRWLLPQEGRANINMPEGFLRLFEAVFGRKHWSKHCFRRSAQASTVGLFIMLVVFDFFRIDGNVSELSIDLIGFLILLALPTNIFGDYLSLWETRALLRIAARKPSVLPILIPLDALLTFSIWLAGLALPLFIGGVVLGYVNIGQVGEFLLLMVDLASQGQLGTSHENLTSPKAIAAAIALGAMLATSYITSIWLWLVVLVMPLVRFLLWSRTSGLSALGRLINTQQKPFTALGYLTSLVIMIIGSAIWGLSFL